MLLRLRCLKHCVFQCIIMTKIGRERKSSKWVERQLHGRMEMRRMKCHSLADKRQEMELVNCLLFSMIRGASRVKKRPVCFRFWFLTLNQIHSYSISVQHPGQRQHMLLNGWLQQVLLLRTNRFQVASICLQAIEADCPLATLSSVNMMGAILGESLNLVSMQSSQMSLVQGVQQRERTRTSGGVGLHVVDGPCSNCKLTSRREVLNF